MKKRYLLNLLLISSLSAVSFMTSCFGADRAKPPEPHKFLDSYIVKTLKLDTIKSVQLEIDAKEVIINFDKLIAKGLEDINDFATKSTSSPEFRFLKENDLLDENNVFDISKAKLSFSKTVSIFDPVFNENNITFNRLICELHVFKEEQPNMMALKNTYKIELKNNFTISNLIDFKNKASSLKFTDFNVDNTIKEINKAKAIANLPNSNELVKLAEFFGQRLDVEKKIANNALLITLKVNKYLLVKDLSLKL